MTDFMAFQLSFLTGEIGQPRAGDSSLMLVGEELDTQGQMKRFSYSVFTKPRFLNCNTMVYLVRTGADILSPGQFKI